MDLDYDTQQAKHTKAFDAVQPASHWKDRIDATITLEAAEEAGGVAAIESAIVHFTATVPTVTYGVGNVRFTADGYWAGPAGDG